MNSVSAQQFLHRYQLDADGHDLGGGFGFGLGGEGRRQTDVLVFRVIAQGVGGPGLGQLDARIGCFGANRLGAPFHDIQADKVPAHRFGPGGDALAVQVALELAEHGIKLGLENGGMLFHMGLYALKIFEEAEVTKLVDLVWADGLNKEVTSGPLHVGGTAAGGADTGAGKGDF